MTKKEKNTVTDIDGNTYNLVQIGKQIWTAENLNVSKYRNGDEIPQVQSKIEWKKLTSGAWCYYENKVKNGVIYGKLYNWFAVNDPRGLAPAGFHIPSNDEWTVLTDALGGKDVAGSKMKVTGTKHFIYSQSNNEDATNESNFTGLPGGLRWFDVDCGFLFTDIGNVGYWWSTSIFYDNTNVYVRSIQTDCFDTDTGRGPKTTGISVRCIKD